MSNKVVLVTLDGVRYCDIIKNKLFKSLMKKGLFLSNILVTNKVKISYPGYKEMLSGVVDPNIVTNNRIKPIPDKIKTVASHLVDDGYIKLNQILISTRWSAFLDVYNSELTGIKPINWKISGKLENIKKSNINFTNYKFKPISRVKNKSNKDIIIHDVRVYREFKHEYLKKKYFYSHLSLGLTDFYGHNGNYREYTNHINMGIDMINDIIKLSDAHTYIIITTDHGRDNKTFKHHDAALPGSEKSWALIIGPTVSKNTVISDQHPMTIIANIIYGIFVDSTKKNKNFFN